ncbi:MAG TPA: DUF1801 domain-containing protein, partial [Gemmataceae bacterium]|nr:DUF1801 domain-containing protein [Gemmataceae bacterium]
MASSPKNGGPAKPKTAARSSARKSSARAEPAASEPASGLIDQRIRELGGWRGETLARMRALIREADPDVTEEWKWDNPVWSHDGIICTGEAYAKVVKLTFARGAGVPDPAGLFNSSLTGNTRRAIDIREGETVDAAAFQTLVKAAVARNGSPTSTAPAAKLLSGGNPQIAKADGDAPVQAYIAAMPGWKSDFGRRLDALIGRAVPDVRKAVRWNSPFYGVDGRGWFLSFHVFTRYVKVTFFAGTSLHPVPPGGTPKSKEVRWIDVYEAGGLDEEQMTACFT